MTEVIQKINAVINTLNEIEVKGAKNLDALLGCMQALDTVCRELMKQGEEGENG